MPKETEGPQRRPRPVDLQEDATMVDSHRGPRLASLQKLVEMEGPQRRPRQASSAENLTGSDIGLIPSGKSLELLLDLVQLFGSLSLWEAASSLHAIARDVPAVLFGARFLWSLFATSILHTVGGAFEVFEGQYTKSWAVLGLNWTTNFSGLLLFFIGKLAVQDTSLPWRLLIAPAIQSVALMYALRKAGTAGRVRMVLAGITAALLVGLALQSHTILSVGTSIGVSRFDLSGHNYSEFAPCTSKDCNGIGEHGSDSFINEAGPLNMKKCRHSFDDEEEQSVSGVPTQHFVTTNPSSIEHSISGKGAAFVLLAVISVLLVGGSFVRLLMRSRFQNVSNCRRILTAPIVYGWLVVYPIYEFIRLLPRVFDWLKCLAKSLRFGDYEFTVDGSIILPGEKEL